MFKNPNGRTLYEITLNHCDGRKYLLVYYSGTPSRARMIDALRTRWDEVEAVTGATEWTKGAGKVLTAGDWTIQYSGRTEWEAKNSNSEIEWIGDLQSVLSSDSGALTLPYALIGLAAYMVYWMISHGVFQALTALQAGR